MSLEDLPIASERICSMHRRKSADHCRAESKDRDGNVQCTGQHHRPLDLLGTWAMFLATHLHGVT